MKRQVDEYYFIERARSWMDKTNLPDINYAKEFIRAIIDMKGCTLKYGNNTVVCNETTVENAKEILRGLNLIKKSRLLR